MRFFSYAVIGVAVGYLLFAFTGLGTELAALAACAVIAGIVAFVRRREDDQSRQPLIEDRDLDEGSYDETQRERWRRDLDIAPSVAGVRGFSIDGDNWKTPEVDYSASGVDDTNRD
jgi:hypothetical protein